MAKAKKPEGLLWFRIYTMTRGTFDAIENENIGAALKAAFLYFDAIQAAAGDTEEAAQARAAAEEIEASITDRMTKIAFNTFKPGIEDSIKAHNFNVENGKAGAEVRAKAQQQTDKGGSDQTPGPQATAEPEQQEPAPAQMTAEQKKAHKQKIDEFMNQYGSPEPQPQPVPEWEKTKGA